MISVTCPWCDGPAEVEGSALVCDACQLREEIATEDAAGELVLAA